jgi:hypothetical protein
MLVYRRVYGLNTLNNWDFLGADLVKIVVEQIISWT